MNDSPTGKIRTLILILLPVALFFAALEIGARIYEGFYPPMPVDLGQGFGPDSRLFVRSEERGSELVTNPEKRVSFHEQSFLYRKPADTFRVFWLGGSSVNYINYELPALEERLREDFSQYAEFDFINCGGLSYGSHRLILILREVLQYDPDLVLLYSGHNEFEELEQLHLANLGFVPAQRQLSRLALFRVIREIVAARRIAELESESETRRLAESVPDASRTWKYIFSPEDIEERMQEYRANIDQMIALCKTRGVPLIVGTVPSNLMRPQLWGEDGESFEREAISLYEAGKFDAGAAKAKEILANATRHQSSPEENGILRDLANTHILSLADVEAAVTNVEPHGVPGETLFSDHCHLNPEGNTILIQTFETKIREYLSDAKPYN